MANMMVFNDFQQGLKKFLKNILVPSDIIFDSFQAEPIITDDMEQALVRWYNMYVNSPEWVSSEIRPLGLPQAIAKEFAQTISSEFSISVYGGQRAKFLEKQLKHLIKNLQEGLELSMALGGVVFKPYVSGRNILIDITSANAFTPLRFDDGGTCVSGVFKSRPVKVGRQYYVKLEYHDFTNGLYTVKNKAYRSTADGVVNTEVPLNIVPDWEQIAPEVYIQNVERPLFGYLTPPVNNNIDTGTCIGVSIYAGATENLIREADKQWARFLYEFVSAERKIMAAPEAISGSLPGEKANPLENDRLYVQMPYDSEDFFKEFSPDLRNTGFYEGLQSILRRIEFNVGLAYGDLSDPSTIEKTATEISAAKTRKFNTVKAAENRLKMAIENVVYGMDVYTTLYGLAPIGEYNLYIDFDDSIRTDMDMQRERDRQDVRDGLMQKWEYRVKYYGETPEVAKAMCTDMDEFNPNSFGFG